MARVNAPQLAFNRGEVSKIALARLDLAKLQLAAQCQLNWLPYVVGPMMLRPGLLHVGGVLSDNPCKLLRFVYSKLDTALIELTGVTMRIWIGEVLLARPAVGTAILDPNFSGTGSHWDQSNSTDGTSVSVTGGVATLTCTPLGGLAQIQQSVTVAAGDQGQEHGIRVVVTNGPVTFRAGSSLGASDFVKQTVLDTGTHSLSCVPTGATLAIQIESTDQWDKTLSSCAIEAAGVVTLPTPWAGTDLPNIRYDQFGDVVYLACYGQAPRMIQRRGVRPGARGWSVVLYKSNDGPFNNLPGITANLTPSVYYGNGTLTSDRPWFQPGHVGALFRLFSDGQFNATELGAANAFSDPVRVAGVGNGNRNYGLTVTGTWSGKLTFQRSFDGPTSGFADNQTTTSNTTLSSSSGGSLDNDICWERIGFVGSDYTSGAAACATNYKGGGGYGICRVTGYTSSTEVSIEVLDAFPSILGTTDWVESQWSGVAGWPTSVAFHEGRLCWFGGGQAWLSASDNYTSFADINLDGTSTGDGGAINVTLGSGPVDTISWGLSLTRLMIGREQSIGSARSSNFDQPLTPTGIVIRDCSDQGAQRLPAIKVGKRGVFVQQSGRKVYELSFSSQETDYDDRDLTRLNLDIGLPGFVDIDKSTQPDKMVWLPRGDGQCAALLYDVKDEVEGWWRLQTLGTIENVAVLPGAGTEDTVYFVVRRTINGVTRRFIERLALRTDCVGGALNKQLDCALVYSGAPVSAVQLPWLPGTAVTVWADGAAIGTGATDGSGNLAMPDGQAHGNIVAGLAGSVVTQTNATPAGTLVVGAQYNGLPCEVFADQQPSGRVVHIGTLMVAGGAVTLPNGITSSAIIACLGYVAPFMSAKLGYGAQMGSALTQKKKVDHLGLCLFDTHPTGITFGQRFDALDPLPLYEGDAAVGGGIWSEYDEPMVEVPGEWNSDSRLCLLAHAPNPCTVGGVVVAVTTNEK